jgi:WD40 repeat protein
MNKNRLFLFCTLILGMWLVVACKPSIVPLPSGSSKGSGEISLYPNAKIIELNEIDKYEFLNSVFYMIDPEYSLYSSSTNISWVKDMGSKVIAYYDKALPDANWRLESDWDESGAEIYISAWRQGDLKVFVYIIDNLTSDQINDLRRLYGVSVTESGATLIIIHIWDTSHLLSTATPSEALIPAEILAPAPTVAPTQPPVLAQTTESKPVKSGEKAVILWGTIGMPVSNSLSKLTRDVTGVAFSPDGNFLASSRREGTVILWDVQSGSEIHTFTGHIGPVWSVAFSPDGKILASGGEDRTVKLWDVAGKSELYTFPAFSTRTDAMRVSDVAFSPDGSILASAEFGAVKLWDVASKRELRTIDLSGGITSDVESLAFSPDGTLLAIGHAASVTLWKVASGQEVIGFPHSGEVANAKFSPDGKIVASADGTIVSLWDVVNGDTAASEYQTLEHSGAISLAFSPDGSVLASGSINGEIELWDTSTWEKLCILPGVGNVESLTFSPDGSILAVGSPVGEDLWKTAP